MRAILSISGRKMDLEGIGSGGGSGDIAPISEQAASPKRLIEDHEHFAEAVS